LNYSNYRHQIVQITKDEYLIEGYFPIKFLLNDYENIITKLSKNQYKKYDKILLRTNYYDWLKIV